ncbi:hypothetical protein ABH926_005291 [Catenulispora sp. GP43]|uniref:hypothetical protein n=1 Tax=Catenulispora sp. GP43 TaxID=3156263 RepID=UPI0035162CC7
MEHITAAVDAVDWPNLKHAYGPATDTAGHLHAALAGDANAVNKLDMSLYHQGGCVYPAAAAAAPILIDLACEPAIAHRPSILDMLSRFAALLLDIREPWRSQPHAQVLRATMQDALVRFIDLLDDAKPGIREAAADIIAAYDSGTDQITDALRRRFPIESDHRVRVVLLLSLGELSAQLPPDARAAVAAWADEATRTDRRARLAGLIARHQLTPARADAADLLEALADPALVAKDYFARAATVGELATWVSHRVDDRDFQQRFATWALNHDEIRTSGAPVFMQVGGVMLRSRVATAELLADVAALLGHPLAEVRLGAAHLLAAAGRCAQPYADLLAAALHDPDDAVATRAVWALAVLGDARAIPDLAAGIEAIEATEADGTLRRFAASSMHYGAEVVPFMVTDLPGLLDVLAPMRQHAEALLPAMRRRLAHETTTPGLHHLTETLAGFGPAAAAALPELRALLDSPHPELACNVLGVLGPHATEAAEDLHRVGTSPLPGAEAAAWAYLRVTGDPVPLLAALSVERGLSGPALTFRRAAALGPDGAQLAEGFATMLDAKPQYWPTWTGIEAAHAHWRITGDPTLCLRVFDTALDPLRHGRQLPISRQVLRYLPALGADAAQFRPLLEDMVASSERLIYSGGWRGIAEDDEAVRLARAAI